jgi:hypothetical protein
MKPLTANMSVSYFIFRYSRQSVAALHNRRILLGPLGTAATNSPIVPAPDDYDHGEIGEIVGRENRSTRRKPSPIPLCPPQNPTCCPEANPAGKPATNRLNYGIATREYLLIYLSLSYQCFQLQFSLLLVLWINLVPYSSRAVYP